MRGTQRSTRWAVLFAAFAVTAAACTGGDDPDPSSDPTTTVHGASNTPANAPADGGSGQEVANGFADPVGAGDAYVGLRLSEGSPGDESGESVTVVEGTPLTDDEVAAVLDRLPEWDLPSTDVSDFERPTESLQPPVVGETVDAPFPASTGAPDDAPTDTSADGPLEVVRFQPEGDVGVAPFVAITFDQPMVELGTLDQLDETDVPVSITPDIAETAGVEGRWRWIGTRTLRFEVVPDSDAPTAADGNEGLDRLPASTDYTVTVPAGTESADGAELDDEVSFEFSTPAVTITELSGLSGSTRLDPVFVAMFDQRVDPDAVVELIDFGAGEVDDVRLASEEEVAADADARAAVDRALDGRAVAFVPTAELEPDTTIDIEIGPDLPSLEGPRTNDEAFRIDGSTFPPLDVVRAECFDDCPPSASWEINLSNPLDPEVFDPDWITVEPAVPGLRVDQFESFLSISGATAGNTTYTVTLAPELVDVFGQQLGEQYETEFDVGDARPFFIGPDREFVTTDPFAELPGLGYTTVNHDRLAVTAWQVDPSQYGEFRAYLESSYSDTRPDGPDWPVLVETTVDVDAQQDTVTETIVDLTSAFDESGGPIVLQVEPDPGVDPTSDDYWSNRPSTTWVQQADIAADVFITNDELLVWVTDLLTGEPIADATIEPNGADTVTADADGIARIPLTQPVDGLEVTAGDRTVMVPSQWFNGWESFDRGTERRWYVIDDRGIYRPGETVRMTGLIRELTAEDAQLALVDGPATVRYSAFDAQGAEIGAGATEVNALGGFNISLDVPEGANAGPAFVNLELVDSPDAAEVRAGFGHEFQVQDFRTPEYEVDVRTESVAPHYIVDPATVAADADYFAGGPLGDAEVEWLVTATETTYDPPSWDEFSFGVWNPWWFGDVFGGDVGDEPFIEPCFDCGPGFVDPRFQRYVGRTDASGTHLLQIDFDDIPGPASDDDGEELVDQPTSVTAEATVFDVNRQAIASRTDLVVHPARYYVGLRSDRGFVEQGEPIVIDTTVVDVDGEPVAGREFEVTVGRLEGSFESGEYVEELVDEQTCTITSTAAVTNDAPDEAMRCEFATDVGGQYEITAIVTDDDGRSNRAVYTQWVSGGTSRPTRDLTRGDVAIVPDTEFHGPGDTAELLVQAPFSPASGLVTVTRAGIASVEAFDAPDGSAVVTIPIEEDDVPSLQVRVDMVGADERVADDGTPLPDAPMQPAYASGQIQLEIPPATRTLDVAATPATENLEPGESTTVSVAVAGPDGEPVADAGVAVIVVDEAVLSLTGYELPDPLETFYQPLFSQLDAQLLRDSIILANPDVFAGDAGRAGGDDAGVTTEAMEEESAEDSAEFDGDETSSVEVADAPAATADAAGESASAEGAPIDVRVDFDALAVFAPNERTGADGSVDVDVDLPDSLTRYRVMAVAVDGADRFGSDESTLTARLPISVRPSAPRFLNFGDQFELPVVVQNQTDGAVEVDVAMETANLDLTGGAGRRVTVPPNDRVEVRFPAAAADVGTARFRAASVGGEFADAAEVDLPVYTPATAEAFATYGVVDTGDPVIQPVLAPTGVVPDFGGLEISTSSTALQALTDAVLYLYDYRYDSADGYASRIMAVAALRDVLDAFDAEGLPDPAELDAEVAADIEALEALQNDDGGFPYWQRGRESIPWVSVQAAHALVLAQQNDYAVDQAVLDSALGHLRSIEDFIPSEYSDETRDAISAYALYVRGIAGDTDPAKALNLYEQGVNDTLQLDSIAQLWTVIEDPDARSEIETTIDNSAVETAGAASLATEYGEDAYLIAHSDRRTDGIVLDALVSETPESDLVPKVVTGLLAGQTQGRWNNAQENSFILLALNSYFDTFESVDPDFVARAWLGDTFAVDEDFRGRSTDTSLTTVPMAEVVAEGDTDLAVAKDGEGRLYYRLGLRYAPDDLELDPRDEGFVVERSYEAVDDPDDVVRREDGTWEIAAGATVRVRLTMVADAQRTHVALIDPLPAGLEPVNPALATATTVPPEDSFESEDGDVPAESFDAASHAAYGSFWRQWYDHQNLRDDRAEAFATILPGGTYEYVYVARATTPGEYVVPPTRAEEIFAPEVFGRSASTAVTVTP
ncbi:alpha-2-macroglobulin family protein [Ilumatobacter nonamiensis]|uniref:alpha-2-macroglobulin family protein n=1 Tax=Ilumatobacter nonamiensis TaxID=467093 RepID=UPI00130EF2CB|nr:alpha-2-macroglobulin family protein [Ilumatobacter nonamiensis]